MFIDPLLVLPAAAIRGAVTEIGDRVGPPGQDRFKIHFLNNLIRVKQKINRALSPFNFLSYRTRSDNPGMSVKSFSL